MAKRKKDSITNLVPDPTTLRPSVAPLAEVEGVTETSTGGPSMKIVWELADGSDRWRRSMRKSPNSHPLSPETILIPNPTAINRSLAGILPKAIKHLHLENGAAAPRLTHDRGDGVEREIYDGKSGMLLGGRSWLI
jgi:hypothetical protein